MNPTIELACIDLDRPNRAVKTLQYCIVQMPPGFFLSSSLFCPFKPDIPQPTGMRYIETGFIANPDRHLYNVWRLREFHRHFTADFVLSIHTDGFIVNGQLWDPKWFQYDYIGAPWERGGIGGNGAFCLRSKKLMQAVAAHPDPFLHGQNEDIWICKVIRKDLEAQGCVFAPFEEALRFSLELEIPQHPRNLNSVFGFHGSKWLRQMPPL